MNEEQEVKLNKLVDDLCEYNVELSCIWHTPFQSSDTESEMEKIMKPSLDRYSYSGEVIPPTELLDHYRFPSCGVLLVLGELCEARKRGELDDLSAEMIKVFGSDDLPSAITKTLADIVQPEDHTLLIMKNMNVHNLLGYLGKGFVQTFYCSYIERHGYSSHFFMLEEVDGGFKINHRSFLFEKVDGKYELQQFSPMDIISTGDSIPDVEFEKAAGGTYSIREHIVHTLSNIYPDSDNENVFGEVLSELFINDPTKEQEGDL